MQKVINYNGFIVGYVEQEKDCYFCKFISDNKEIKGFIDEYLSEHDLFKVTVLNKFEKYIKEALSIYFETYNKDN